MQFVLDASRSHTRAAWLSRADSVSLTHVRHGKARGGRAGIRLTAGRGGPAVRLLMWQVSVLSSLQVITRGGGTLSGYSTWTRRAPSAADLEMILNGIWKHASSKAHRRKPSCDGVKRVLRCAHPSLCRHISFHLPYFICASNP